MHSNAVTGTPAQRDQVKEAAIRCICAVPIALDAWAQTHHIDAQNPAAADNNTDAGDNSTANTPPSGLAVNSFEAVKAIKDTRATGLAMFEANPLKGIKFLQNGGVVRASPQDAAAWLRANVKHLNRDSLGELFGMSNELCVAIMHAWVDQVCPFSSPYSKPSPQCMLRTSDFVFKIKRSNFGLF